MVAGSHCRGPFSAGWLAVSGEHFAKGLAVPELLVVPEREERGDSGVSMGWADEQRLGMELVEIEVVDLQAGRAALEGVEVERTSFLRF